MNFVTHTHALLRIHTVKPTTATAKLAQKRRALQAQSGVDKVTNMLSSLSVQDAPTHTHTEPVASDHKSKGQLKKDAKAAESLQKRLSKARELLALHANSPAQQQKQEEQVRGRLCV
jgi:hypothetical protein